MFFSLHFFMGKTYMFEHRKLTKKLVVRCPIGFRKKGSKLTILSIVFLNIFHGIRMRLFNLA